MFDGYHRGFPSFVLLTSVVVARQRGPWTGVHLPGGQSLAAVGAGELLGDGPAAAGVFHQAGWAVLAGEVPVPPVQEPQQRGEQFQPFVGEPVLVAGRPVLIAHPLEHPVLDQAV